MTRTEDCRNMGRPSCFQTLGIDDNSTTDQVKDAWRELARIHHPDKGGNPDNFVPLLKAYKEALTKANEPKKCASCKGSGQTKQGSGFSFIHQKCNACKGKGVT